MWFRMISLGAQLLSVVVIVDGNDDDDDAVVELHNADVVEVEEEEEPLHGVSTVGGVHPMLCSSSFAWSMGSISLSAQLDSTVAKDTRRRACSA